MYLAIDPGFESSRRSMRHCEWRQAYKIQGPLVVSQNSRFVRQSHRPRFLRRSPASYAVCVYLYLTSYGVPERATRRKRREKEQRTSGSDEGAVVARTAPSWRQPPGDPSIIYPSAWDCQPGLQPVFLVLLLTLFFSLSLLLLRYT